MNAKLIILLILMFATLAVLVAGIVGMMRGSDAQKSNKLMSLRVGLQAATILLLGVMFMAGKH